MNEEQKIIVKDALIGQHLKPNNTISANYIYEWNLIGVIDGDRRTLIKVLTYNFDEDYQSITDSNRTSTKAKAANLGYDIAAIYAVNFEEGPLIGHLTYL